MTILVDGDSAAMSSVDGQKSWPEIIGATFLGGRSRTVLDAVQSLTDIQWRKPSVYICQFGLWSAWKPREYSHNEPINEFYTRLVGLLTSLREMGVKAIFITPPVYLEDRPYLYDVRRYGMMGMIAAYKTGAWGISVDAFMLAESLHNPDWRSWFMANDPHYHLSPLGHEKVASYLRPHL